MIEFVHASIDHIEPILSNLRPQERKTIEKLGIDAVDLLNQTIRSTEPSFTALEDGVPVCMWGLTAPTMLGEHKLWMLTTPAIEAHKILFLRKTRQFVQWARDNYGPVIGAVDCDFTESKNWLNWIGFKEIQTGPYIIMRYS